MGKTDHPVFFVSWHDAQSFANWLSAKTGREYRLPSEAEWEYAIRAGSNHRFSWGNQFRKRSYADGYTRPNRVGSFSANSWGLHDMHGNVTEWVHDCSNRRYEGAPMDGSAWVAGDCSRRMIRGGDFYWHAVEVRAARRSQAVSSARRFELGFRVARSLEE